MGDLQVATDELRDLGTRLGRLASDLSRLDATRRHDRAGLAHRRVVGAMADFHASWDDNRDHLADKLGKLGDLATETAGTLDRVDEDLAGEIRRAIEESR